MVKILCSRSAWYTRWKVAQRLKENGVLVSDWEEQFILKQTLDFFPRVVAAKQF